MNQRLRVIFFVLFGVVLSTRLRRISDISTSSLLQTFTDVTTEEPTTTVGWSTVGTDEPATFMTTTATPTGNDITTIDPSLLTINATVNASTVTGEIPASEDVMNMCNCASAAITTLLNCDPPLASCYRD